MLLLLNSTACKSSLLLYVLNNNNEVEYVTNLLKSNNKLLRNIPYSLSTETHCNTEHDLEDIFQQHPDHSLHLLFMLERELKIMAAEMLNVVVKHLDFNNMFDRRLKRLITIAIRKSHVQAIDAIWTNQHLNYHCITSILNTELQRNDPCDAAMNAFIVYLLKLWHCTTPDDNYMKGLDCLITEYSLNRKHTEYLKYVVLNYNPRHTQKHIVDYFVQLITSYQDGTKRSIAVVINKPYNHHIIGQLNTLEKQLHYKISHQKKMILIYIDQMLKFKIQAPYIKGTTNKIKKILHKRTFYVLVTYYLEATICDIFVQKKSTIPRDILHLLKLYISPNHGDVLTLKLPHLDLNICQVLDSYQEPQKKCIIL